jgi:hypothetical protein
MKQIFLILTLVLGFTAASFAQNSYLNDRLSLKLGYNKTPLLSNWKSKLMDNNLWIEGNYGHNNFLESGIYLGYTNCTNYDTPTEQDQNIQTYISHALFYGVNTNLQIIPLLNIAQEPRFDLYISGKLGLVSFIAPKQSVINGSAFNASIHLGVGYFFTRKFGVYAEYGFSKKIKLNEFEPGYKLGIAVKL